MGLAIVGGPSGENTVPDDDEDAGNEDEAIVHQTASDGDVEVCIIISMDSHYVPLSMFLQWDPKLAV